MSLDAPDVQTPQLAPSSYPIALFPNFIAQQSETIIMTEKLASLVDDSYYVRDLSGRDILAIKGKTFSPLHAEKNRDPWSIPTSYFVQDPSGKRVLDVKGKWSLVTNAQGIFENAAQGGKQESLYMKGDWFNVSTTIRNESTDEVVAEIDRQILNTRNILGGRQTYAVTVAPGVDIALIVSMCVCLDEKRDQMAGGS